VRADLVRTGLQRWRPTDGWRHPIPDLLGSAVRHTRCGAVVDCWAIRSSTTSGACGSSGWEISIRPTWERSSCRSRLKSAARWSSWERWVARWPRM